MQIFAVFTTENVQWSEIPDFGRIRKADPLIINQFRMVRIEAKRKCKFGEIPVPHGIELTIHVLDDEDTELTL